MRSKIFFFAFVTVLFSTFSLSGANTLFKNGRSKYVIVVNDDAFYSERTAAAELHDYLKQISGADIPVTNKASRTGKNVVIGFDEASFNELGISLKQPEEDDESFTCFSNKGNIFIYGGSRRGTMYGVYSFLEKMFGVKWYASDCEVVPKCKKFSFDDFSWSETPAIKLREVMYRDVAADPVWCARNRINLGSYPVRNDHGGIEGYWNAHTMGQFVSAKEYFKDHPEYFAFRDGKRIPDGQLCLSNPDVLKICIRKMLDAIRERPGYYVYSMSQNDNQGYCECDKCKAIEERYGAHSGLILWFVNQVADAVKAQYPDVMIGTFAYLYTLPAPKGIVPRDNMVIRVCDLESCFAHPLDNCEYNDSFIKAIKAWSEIAPKMFIWDYVVNFHQYQAPFPNYNILADNIKAFKRYNAIGIREQAQYQAPGGEFSQLRSWLLAKLLWNPYQDTKALAKEFISAYYGKVSPYIQKYYEMSTGLVNERTHFGIYIDENNPLYNDEFVENALSVLNQARDASEGDEVLVARVDAVRLQPLYLKLTRHSVESKNDGTLDEFRRILESGGYRISENRSEERFLNELYGKK